jgi:radical SAM modification target selenobiotic family peptide
MGTLSSPILGKRPEPSGEFPYQFSMTRSCAMETKDLKKILAGFGIAGLLVGAGLTAPTVNAAGSSG